jgi:CHAT domain-containing protein
MIKFALCLFSLLGVLAGCKQNAPDPAATRSQESSSKPQEPGIEVSDTAASPEARFLRLKQKLEQGRYEDVMSEAREAYHRTEEHDPVWAWRFRLLQAGATTRALQAETALGLLNIQPPAGLPVDEFARKDIVTAEAWCALGKNQEGIAVLKRAKPLLAAPAVNPVLNAEWLFIRGKCEPSNSEAARIYYEQTKNLAHGKDKFLEASSEGNLAYRLSLLERFDEALDHYKMVLGLAKEMDSPVLQDRALDYMAQSYYELGQYQKAEQYAILSEKLAAELGRVDHQARDLIDVGVDEQSRGRLAEAEDYYLKAISLARRDYEHKDASARTVSDDIIARSLNNLTVVELSRQSFEKAEDYHNRAASLKMTGDDLLTWKLSQIDLALARKDFPVARAALTHLFSEKEQGFRLRWSAQERMAQMYELMGNLSEAETWYRTTINTAVESSAELNHQEYKTSVLSNLDFFSNYIEFLVRTDRPNQALQVAEIGRARALALKLDHRLPVADTSAWLAKIQSGLKHSDKVVLAYWQSKTQLYIWLVTASQVKLVKQAHGVRELERLVTGYQKETADHSSLDGSPAARRLYEILVEPLESLIPKGSQVVIVAHGNLYEINFESLIVPRPVAHYWIEDVRLENAISLSHVINSSQRPLRYKKDMLAIGDAIQVDAAFPYLPNASEEIARVTKFFLPSLKQVFTAEHATPQAFLTSNPDDYRYIHFVAHGTNFALEPMDSAIILSPGKDNSYKLYARDIADLKRPLQAELVTISSCESAGISVNDLGGPIGLSSAFMHAGARQVVAALWKVDDAATPQLMDQFYSELAKGKTASEALRDAKLAMLRNKRHQSPFYWAMLQLYSRS